MRSIKYLLLFFYLAMQGWATDYSPWFPPFLKLQSEMSYLYKDIDLFHSTQGNFKLPSHHHTLYLNGNITPWPEWNIEGELFFTQTSQIPFSYEASRLTLRHSLFDEPEGLSFASGLTLTFPRKGFTQDRGFLYRAPVEAEWHIAAGKEWGCQEEWVFRLWAAGGIGVALKGCPWFHEIIWVQYKPRPFIVFGLFTEGIYGFGKRALTPLNPFPGYGLIRYRHVDIGAVICLEKEDCANLFLIGWVNTYSHNAPFRDWGLKVSLQIPILF